MRSQIMKRAWEIFRTLTGDRIAKLSAALKKAWAEFKNAACEVLNGWNVTKLVDAGAKRWTKYGKDRIYIRGMIADIMGLDIEYYKSGNIWSAYMDGEKISNSEAYRIIGAFSDAYIDLANGKVYGFRSAKHGETFIEKLTSSFGA